MHRQRAFLLFAIFTAAAATPAWGQALAPAAGSATSGARGAASIPDFSGMWGHPSLTGGFEPPPSGPGPVTNRSRRNGVSNYLPVRRRLHQSDLEAPGGGSREEARRNLVGRRDLSDPGQPVLARAGAVHFSRILACRCSSSRTRSPSFIATIMKFRQRAPEPAPSRAGDAVLVWGFRRPLRRRHAGDRHRGDQDRAVRHGRLFTARRTPRLCMWWNVTG